VLFGLAIAVPVVGILYCIAIGLLHR